MTNDTTTVKTGFIDRDIYIHPRLVSVPKSRVFSLKKKNLESKTAKQNTLM